MPPSTLSPPAQQAVKIIDTQGALEALLESLICLPPTPPSLYMDLEGDPLSRNGTISILSLFVSPLQKTFLIDIKTLGTAAFATQVPYSTSLASILASEDILKVLFDVRTDSDALFGLFGVELNGVIDVQILELASRDAIGRYSRDWLAGLGKCVENDSTLPAASKAEWRENKQRISLDGRYDVLSQRPFSVEAMKYCAQDVTVLPNLWKVYSDKLAPQGKSFWWSMVKKATDDRIENSQSGRFIADDKANSRGPWSQDEIEQRIGRGMMM